MVDTELRRDDPLEGRCGLIDDRFEFYAIPVPQCSRARMAISIDRRRGRRSAAMQHGAVSTKGACDAAFNLVARHRKLLNPLRED